MRFCVIGGELPFIERLAGAFEPRIDDAVAFARDNRVLLLLKTRAGVGFGIALAGMLVELKDEPEIMSRLERRRLDFDR